MAQLNNRHTKEVVYTVTLPTGVASLSFYFKAPSYVTRISHLDVAADNADGTNYIATCPVSISGTATITSTAVNAVGTPVRNTAIIAGQRDIIPPNAVIKIAPTYGGTATSVTGVVIRLVTYGSN